MEEYIGHLDMSDTLCEYKGYNVLYTENISNSVKNVFEKYYSTNLPLINEINESIIIDNIDIYNSQILYKQMKVKNEWIGCNLFDQFMLERKERLNNREKNANEIRNRYYIDIESYANEDITSEYYSRW
ncbi:MAG: hypothetical protein Q4F88_03630 [Eubacteriales bacterium]|nr:hypothetical protein [Eubacteriales bacterium]